MSNKKLVIDFVILDAGDCIFLNFRNKIKVSEYAKAVKKRLEDEFRKPVKFAKHIIADDDVLEGTAYIEIEYQD